MKRTRLIVLIGLGLLTVLLLARLGNIDLGSDVLRRIRLGYLLAAIVVHYSGFAMRGDRWRRLLAAMGYRVSFVYALTLLLAGWFVSFWTFILFSGLVTYLAGFGRVLTVEVGPYAIRRKYG